MPLEITQHSRKNDSFVQYAFHNTLTCNLFLSAAFIVHAFAFSMGDIATVHTSVNVCSNSKKYIISYSKSSAVL